jgi:hypothetical protein
MGWSLADWLKERGGGMSRQHAYNLRESDPDAIPHFAYVGRKIVITDQADREWQERMKQRALAKLEATKETREKRAAARKAASVARREARRASL